MAERNTLRAENTNSTSAKLFFRPNAPGSRLPAPGTRWRLIFEGTYTDCINRAADQTDGSGDVWVHDHCRGPACECSKYRVKIESPGLFG